MTPTTNRPVHHPVETTLSGRLGAVVRQRRTLLGMSQKDLGEKIEVSFQQVQKYEKGHNQPTISRLVDLARSLDTNVGELVDSALSEEPPPRLHRQNVPGALRGDTAERDRLRTLAERAFDGRESIQADTSVLVDKESLS